MNKNLARGAVLSGLRTGGVGNAGNGPPINDASANKLMLAFTVTGLRTSNVVESPFSPARLRITVSRRFKSQNNATCMIWKNHAGGGNEFQKT